MRNDRLGKKVQVKCNEDDTISDLKKLVAAQTGTRPEKIRIQKWYNIYKDHITLKDYEIHDGMGLELYYNLATAPLSLLSGTSSSSEWFPLQLEFLSIQFLRAWPLGTLVVNMIQFEYL